MPVWRHGFRHGELNALRFVCRCLEDTAVAADDQGEEEHARQIAEEGDEPRLRHVQQRDAAVEEGYWKELHCEIGAHS